MLPNTVIKIVKSKTHLIEDIENLKGYLNTLSLEPNANWGNRELHIFEKLQALGNQLGSVQSAIKNQYTYPKPIKLNNFLYLTLHDNWKTMIKLFQNCPGVKDMGNTTIKSTGFWGGDREVAAHKFLIPKGTIGFLMGIAPTKNKVTYTIAIPEPISMKVQKSNYIDVVDEKFFSFDVTEEEKKLLKKALINLYAGRMKGENLKLVARIDDILKGWN